MKKLKTLKTKIFYLNVWYSGLWIKVTGTDKWTYREKSIVHRILISFY